MMTNRLIRTLFLLALTGQVQYSQASPPFQAAQWIAPKNKAADMAGTPLFRKEFSVKAKPTQATLRIVGLGDYDFWINGRKPTEVGINQPWSQYEKTLYYRDFDITSLIDSGTNCVGILLTNSFWNNPDAPAGRYNKGGPQTEAQEPYLLSAEVILKFQDSSTLRVGTDESWRVSEGPITFSHIFGGEDFDARRVQNGWASAGFDASEWSFARLAAEPPAQLEPMFFLGIEAFEPNVAATIKETSPGVFLYSFPANTAAQLSVELEGGQPGNRIHFLCGEHKNDRDRLFGGYLVGCDIVTDGGPLIHQWSSFYLGFQFVEVTGAVPNGHENSNNLPVIRKLEQVPVHAGLKSVGTFHCSSDLYNRTHDLIDTAMRSNMSWVMTDCPHREKLGWLECAYLLAPTFLYRYDGREWFAKIAHDIRDAQESSGRVLTVAPSYPAGRFPGDFNWTVEWGAAAVMVPWRHYQWFGDPRILEDNFDMMCRFTDYIQTESEDGLAPGGLGDWYDYGHGQPPGPSRFTPTELTATATWALCALTVSRAAEALGRVEEAAKYRDLHDKIAAEFRRHFQDPDTRKIQNNGSAQCSSAMALCADLVPASDRAMLLKDILDDLEVRDYQQTPGDVGHVYFIRALAEAGRSDILHKVYSREGTGSYGGILAKGLSSLPETWDAMMDGYQSLNHCMLGHVMEWFYGYVGGIRQKPGGIGWREVVIAPNPGSLSSAETTLEAPTGQIVSRWSVENGVFSLEAEIPEGVEAVAILPSGKKQPLKSGFQTLVEAYP
ncbi:MAG: alpha-L-rhamnosidase N-terminal domain-containing protein [Candidatus Omnitrophica bacterium]|nr:alpha-L-rhamnosidase N-terminal domain-containing protein [Candidatus Omnitrophota bacterium]